MRSYENAACLPELLSFVDGIVIVEAGEQRPQLEQEFPQVAFTWLTTSVGDQDVFLLDKRSYGPPPRSS
jgi:hypothetical protein